MNVLKKILFYCKLFYCPPSMLVSFSCGFKKELGLQKENGLINEKGKNFCLVTRISHKFALTLLVGTVPSRRESTGKGNTVHVKVCKRDFQKPIALQNCLQNIPSNQVSPPTSRSANLWIDFCLISKKTFCQKISTNMIRVFLFHSYLELDDLQKAIVVHKKKTGHLSAGEPIRFTVTIQAWTSCSCKEHCNLCFTCKYQTGNPEMHFDRASKNPIQNQRIWVCSHIARNQKRQRWTLNIDTQLFALCNIHHKRRFSFGYLPVSVVILVIV